MAAPVSTFTLSNGVKIPSVGFGCWMGEAGAGKDQELQNALKAAFEAGYRHFDTARAYGNEKEVGEAVKASGVPREEVFVTSKFWQYDHDDVARALKASEEDLGLTPDLYLMHWPMATDKDGNLRDDITFNETWRQMEDLYLAGKVRAIGVSNFSVQTLTALLKTARVVPQVNQVELHPYLPQPDLLSFCREHNILLTAYSPLGQYDSPILSDSAISAIADAHKVSTGTVLLSWGVQRGTAVVPKSGNPKRIRDNITLVNLTSDEMRTIDDLHNKEGKHLRLVKGVRGADRIFGWTHEQMGWQVR